MQSYCKIYVINNKSNKTNITLWDKWILLEVCIIDNKSNCGCLIVKEEKKNGRPYFEFTNLQTNSNYAKAASDPI